MSDNEGSFVAESVDSGATTSPSILVGLERLNCGRKNKNVGSKKDIVDRQMVYTRPTTTAQDQEIDTGSDTESDSQETQMILPRNNESQDPQVVSSEEFPPPPEKLRKVIEDQDHVNAVEQGLSKESPSTISTSIPRSASVTSDRGSIEAKKKGIVEVRQMKPSLNDEGSSESGSTCLELGCICKEVSVSPGRLKEVQDTVQQLLKTSQDAVPTSEAKIKARHLVRAMQQHMRQLSKAQQSQLQSIRELMKQPSFTQPPDLKLQLQRIMTEKQQMLQLIKTHRGLASALQDTCRPGEPTSSSCSGTASQKSSISNNSLSLITNEPGNAQRKDHAPSSAANFQTSNSSVGDRNISFPNQQDKRIHPPMHDPKRSEVSTSLLDKSNQPHKSATDDGNRRKWVPPYASVSMHDSGISKLRTPETSSSSGGFAAASPQETKRDRPLEVAMAKTVTSSLKTPAQSKNGNLGNLRELQTITAAANPITQLPERRATQHQRAPQRSFTIADINKIINVHGNRKQPNSANNSDLKVHEAQKIGVTTSNLKSMSQQNVDIPGMSSKNVIPLSLSTHNRMQNPKPASVITGSSTRIGAAPETTLTENIYMIPSLVPGTIRPAYSIPTTMTRMNLQIPRGYMSTPRAATVTAAGDNLLRAPVPAPAYVQPPVPSMTRADPHVASNQVPITFAAAADERRAIPPAGTSSTSAIFNNAKATKPSQHINNPPANSSAFCAVARRLQNVPLSVTSTSTGYASVGNPPVQQSQLQSQKRPATLTQLLEANILQPGTDVLSFASSGDGKVYWASIDTKGVITEKIRGCFSGPSQWTAAVLNKSIQAASKTAWKSVFFKGKSLSMLQQEWELKKRQGQDTSASASPVTTAESSPSEVVKPPAEKSIILQPNLRVLLVQTDELSQITKEEWGCIPSRMFADMDIWEE